MKTVFLIISIDTIVSTNNQVIFKLCHLFLKLMWVNINKASVTKFPKNEQMTMDGYKQSYTWINYAPKQGWTQFC